MVSWRRRSAGVFAPTDAQQEIWAAERLRARLPDLAITLSHEIGRLGLLERENAAVLNACLAPLAQRHDRRVPRGGRPRSA